MTTKKKAVSSGRKPDRKRLETGKVVLDISMSLDGFIAGKNDGPTNPLGDGGMRLHDWLWGNKPKRAGVAPGQGASGSDPEVIDELFRTTGAILTGRRTYDIVNGWGGSHPIQGVPIFVLSKAVPDKVPKGASTFTFVADGIISIVKQAKAAAGGKDYVLGGANIAQQCLGSGLLDEMQIPLMPVLLGDGVRLFDHIGVGQIELERTRAIDSPGVSHLRFRVMK